jgi:hypothetical protein
MKIEINSNSSRVDYVQTLANQLKLQMAQTPHSIPPDERYRRILAKLDSVADAVKSGDPQKAELALASAQDAVSEIQALTGTLPAGPESVDTRA